MDCIKEVVAKAGLGYQWIESINMMESANRFRDLEGFGKARWDIRDLSGSKVSEKVARLSKGA